MRPEQGGRVGHRRRGGSWQQGRTSLAAELEAGSGGSVWGSAPTAKLAVVGSGGIVGQARDCGSGVGVTGSGDIGRQKNEPVHDINNGMWLIFVKSWKPQ